MDIKDYKPRRGDDTYRIGDSDDLVVMENIKAIPTGGMCQQNHGIIFICTAGRAQFATISSAWQICRTSNCILSSISTMKTSRFATPISSCCATG